MISERAKTCFKERKNLLLPHTHKSSPHKLSLCALKKSAMNREASDPKLSGETAYGETKYLWMNVKVLSIIVGCAFMRIYTNR